MWRQLPGALHDSVPIKAISWIPPCTPSNNASSLSWYPRIQQSTSICYTRSLDISWFLVHSLSDCYVSFIQIYKHILLALPNPMVNFLPIWRKLYRTDTAGIDNPRIIMQHFKTLYISLKALTNQFKFVT